MDPNKTHSRTGSDVGIEEKLRRLLPAAPSDSAQVSMEACIDELAAEVDGAGSSINHSPFSLWSKVAAVLVIGAISLVWFAPERNDAHVPEVAAVELPESVSMLAASEEDEFEILKSTERVAGHSDDGLVIPFDGSTPYYRSRTQMVDEDEIRDTQTGIIVTVRQTRQEVHTTPVIQF